MLGDRWEGCGMLGDSMGLVGGISELREGKG